MNEIHHRQIVIDLDLWMPFKKEVESEIDDVLGKLKDKTLLKHAGNVKATLRNTEEK